MNGHSCDNCNKSLDEREYDRYGSWSYTCNRCGFRYNHSSSKSAQEQVDDYQELQDELEEMYDEDIEEDEDD